LRASVTVLPRRRLLISALAGTAIGTAPRVPFAASLVTLPSDSANRRFSIFYKGDRIGAHVVSNTPATGETRVTTEIDLVVKAMFFTVYSFSHRSEERWRDGRLVALKSDTTEHGERLSVVGSAVAQGFRVVSKDGPFIAAASALTSNSLWTPAVLEQQTVIDAQHGGIIGVSVHRLADERLTIAGAPVRTARYRFVSPYLAGSIWYDDLGWWVHGEFERDGAKVEYRLDA
jgi:hypothetical protein